MSDQKDKMSVKKDILWRIYLAFFFVCALGVAILMQAFKIQTIEGTHLIGLADSLTTDYKPIEAERGNVLSADGRLLATSLPFFEVRADFNADALTDNIFYNNVDSLAWYISKYKSDKSIAEYKKLLIKSRRSGNRYLLIATNVTYPELQQMKTWPMFRLGRYKGGLIAIQNNKRVMPFKMLAHRTIGYVRDDIKPVGLEGSFDSYLSGVKGKRLMQKIAGGTWIPVNDENEINSENGNDLITTIDVNLQDVAQDALRKAIQKHKADHGCVIVMEVKTGKIKAIANIGAVGENGYWETYNYAIGEATEPGSTFKVATMIALLEDKLIDIHDSVDLEKGETKYYDKTMPDSEEHDFRNVTVKTAFEISSNVGISKLANKFYAKTPDQFIQHLKRMRLDQKTGVEIQGEVSPMIKNATDKKWSGITLPWMSVGYELTITPLQILTFYNAIANDGVMLRPYLVQEIQRYGKTVEKFKPVVLTEKLCSKSTLDKIKMLLEGVVENEKGTAHNLQTENYRFAGKTGTARIADNNKGYAYKKVYQASFAGYFPADDPIYSCIVVINSPKILGYYGGHVAGPVFKEIADKIYANSIDTHHPMNKREYFLADMLPGIKAGCKEDIQTIYNSMGVSSNDRQGSEWISPEKNQNSIDLQERKVAEGMVPDVRGMGLRDALYLLENHGLKVSFTGRGKVSYQSIKYGTKTTKGREIILILS